MILRLHKAAALAAAILAATPALAGPDYSASKKAQYPSPNFLAPDADRINLRSANSTGEIPGMTVNGRSLGSIISGVGGRTTLTPDAITGDASDAAAIAPGAAAARALKDLVGFAAGNTSTIATLRALPTAPLVPGIVVAVSGYYAAGDGGGGLFTWSPGSTAADDAALTIQPSGASGAGRWTRIVSGPLSVRMFGARGDGVADDSPSIRAAYLASTALGQRMLSCTRGVYRLAASVVLTDGVILTGGRDCVMRGADNGPDTLFEAGSVNNVGFTGLTIDGNAANNSANHQINNKALIHFRNAANAFARDVAFRDAPGIGIAGYGDNNDYSNNIFTNVRDRAVFHLGTAQKYAKNLSFKNNLITGPMTHAINIAFEDSFDVSGNIIQGEVIGLRSPMRVSVSGSQVTYTGGPTDFSNVVRGQFLVMDRGKEYYILGRSGNTITVAPDGAGNPPPAGANQVAVVGSGDLIGSDSVRNGKISGNVAGRTATFGGGVISSGGAASNVTVSGNAFYLTGKHGWVVSAESPTATIDRVKVVGNSFDEAGSGADAVSDFERSSIIVAAGPGSVKGTVIDGNSVTSDTSAYGPVYNWLGFDLSMQPGSVMLGKANASTTFNGKAIANDIKSITLAPGWGSTATANSITSTGDRVDVTIRAGGTGQGGYPRGVISKVSDVAPIPSVQAFIRSSAGPGDIRFPIGVDDATAGRWPFTWSSGDAPAAPSGADPTTFVTTFVAH